MEDILTYVIVFGLIIGGVAFWQFRNSKPRPYLLSQQVFPELKLFLIIEKSDGKTKDFIIKFINNEHIETLSPLVELINEKRDSEIIELDSFLKGEAEINTNEDSFIYKYSFSKFSQLLKDNSFNFKTFRIVIPAKNGRKFKSHELAFNKRWTIYLPDSGKYN